MIITNKHNLPKPFVRAVTPKRDPWERRGGAHISVTELLGPPRIKQLSDANWDQIVVDASDLLWMMFGSVAHDILHRNSGREFAERRLNVTVDGMVISGQVDLVEESDEGRKIVDYKMTSVWAYILGRQEWEEQLNVYRYLLIKNGEDDVVGLENVLMLKDWRKADTDKEGYPEDKVVKIVHPLWPLEKTEAFIRGRVAEHRRVMPECNPIERMRKGDMWAIQKPNAARATKVFDSEFAAKGFLKQCHDEGKTELVLVPRPGEDKRCLDFCRVAEFCDYGRMVRGFPPISTAEPE